MLLIQNLLGFFSFLFCGCLILFIWKEIFLSLVNERAEFLQDKFSCLKYMQLYYILVGFCFFLVILKHETHIPWKWLYYAFIELKYLQLTLGTLFFYLKAVFFINKRLSYSSWPPDWYLLQKFVSAAGRGGGGSLYVLLQTVFIIRGMVHRQILQPERETIFLF